MKKNNLKKRKRKIKNNKNHLSMQNLKCFKNHNLQIYKFHSRQEQKQYTVIKMAQFVKLHKNNKNRNINKLYWQD